MYDHRQVEKEILSFWEKERIMEKADEKNKNGEPFYFCDGPPYATGQIHPGTGWNKTLKDAVCRYWRMRGRRVRAQAGYDTHGLPIEVKVEQELKIRNKNEIESYGIARFTERCREFATRYIGIMSRQFRSLGVWMDFEAPYITYRDSYIESSWKTLKMAYDKGLMHEGVYVLPYCYRCETTMANYELEYGEESDPSIFVKLAVEGKKGEYLIIWTTTPWTLVANMGVMAHPTHKYVKVQVDGEIWILAKERLDALLERTGKSATILEEVSGRKLNGICYLHPFQKKIKKQAKRKVVLSDEYVTMEEGSGLVHTAPGHGMEDFLIGKRFDIEAFCPVDGKGNYTAEAGDFEGKNVREANSEIIGLLGELGILVHEERIKHRYPHCWRCKTPLIFITTKQWFIAISKIKDKMLEEISNTGWHPDFAKERFREFVAGAPDWCISRQRYWGIPLPIWRCASCGRLKVIGSSGELGAKIKELHRPYIDEVKFSCGCNGEMCRVPDVLDVWFDSGNAVWASLLPEEAGTYSERSDIIIEGQDQIRGWFYSLLGSGIIRYGSCPYKQLLMHGFFVDEHGEKMSKSVGNFIPLEDILDRYGADSFRLWGMSNTVWDELKFSWEEIKKASSDLNILFNLVTFLERFYVRSKSKAAELNAEDKWVLSALHSAMKVFKVHMENYELNRASKAVRSFLVEDVSRFYMKLAKDRIQRDENGAAALETMFTITFESLKMLSLFSPFISEHLYRKFFMKYLKGDSVFMHPLGAEDASLINQLSEKQMGIIREAASIALTARQAAGVKLRWPVRSVIIETSSHEVVDAVAAFNKMLSVLLNAKEVVTVDKVPKGEFASQPFSSGIIHVNKRIDEELYEEGIINEIKRRVQAMRKEAGLVESDRISILFSSESEIEAIVDKWKKHFCDAVNAKKLGHGVSKGMKEFEIDGRIVKLLVQKY